MASPTPNAISRLSYQFRLRTLFTGTLLIGVVCGSARRGGEYVVAAMTLAASLLLVRLFASSPYQTHPRVLTTFFGGLLYLAALWLPVSADFEILGWQAAWLYVDRAWHVDYASILPARSWDFANIWMIVVGNVTAWILPPLMIWAPRRMSILVTLLAGLMVAQAWSFAIVEPGIKFSEGEVGFWMWCVSLTLLLCARLVPFRWQLSDIDVCEEPPRNPEITE